MGNIEFTNHAICSGKEQMFEAKVLVNGLERKKWFTLHRNIICSDVRNGSCSAPSTAAIIN
jgi:hypothetical protein